MSVAEIKQKLHNVIDGIDNEELLVTMLTILAHGNDPKGYNLTDEQLRLLQEREENYLSGKSKVKTFEEFQNKMAKKNSL